MVKKIVIDIDKKSHKKKTIDIDSFILSDAKKFFEKIVKFTRNENLNDYVEWIKQCNEWKKKYPVCRPIYKQNKRELNSYLLVDTLCKHSKKNDIFGRKS